MNVPGAQGTFVNFHIFESLKRSNGHFKTKDTLDMQFKVKHAIEALTLLYFKPSFIRGF